MNAKRRHQQHVQNVVKAAFALSFTAQYHGDLHYIVGRAKMSALVRALAALDAHANGEEA